MRRSEERFRSLAQNSSDVVTVVDADRNVLYQSPSMEKVLGHDPEERIGKNLAEHSIVHPDDAAEQDAAFARAIANPGEGVGAEVRVRHSDGSWRRMEAIYTSLLDDPRVGGVVLNARDVTERRRAEEELRLRDRAIASSSNGIVITDPNLPDNPIVYANRGFERMTGYASEEAMGRNCRFLQGTDRDQPARHGLRAALQEGREWTGVLRNYRKDGAVFYNETYVSPVRGKGGRVTHFVGVQTDVTERLRTEEELRRREESLSASQRIARLGSWEFYPETGETRWSDELYRIFGLEPRQFVPNRRSHLRFVHPEDRDFVVGNTFGGADRVDSYDRSLGYRIVRQDGEVRFVHNRREVSFDETGRPIRINGIVQDVTER